MSQTARVLLSFSVIWVAWRVVARRWSSDEQELFFALGLFAVLTVLLIFYGFWKTNKDARESRSEHSQ